MALTSWQKAIKICTRIRILYYDCSGGYYVFSEQSMVMYLLKKFPQKLHISFIKYVQ